MRRYDDFVDVSAHHDEYEDTHKQDSGFFCLTCMPDRRTPLANAFILGAEIGQ